MKADLSGGYKYLALLGLLALLMLTVGCGKSAGTTTAITASALQLCGREVTWEAQRACLVGGYRTDIDRCYALDQVTRLNCVGLVQQRYNLQSADYSHYLANLTHYQRHMDPFYLQQAQYLRLFSTAYTVDPWQFYWNQAVINQTYYNAVYMSAYSDFYTMYYDLF